MPTLNVDARLLVGGEADALAGEAWTLRGATRRTGDAAGVLVGGPYATRAGVLDGSGRVAIQDVPETPADSWLVFELARFGSRWAFQMPDHDTTLESAWRAFGEPPDPVGPVPGPPGPMGNPGPAGPEGAPGPVGPEGAFQVSVFRVAETQPDPPTGGSYRVSFKRWVTLPSGWSATPPTPSGTETLWFAQAIVTPVAGTDPVTPAWGGVGEAGGVGPTGPPGPKGDKGDRGSVGPAGPQGDQGDTGDVGPAGGFAFFSTIPMDFTEVTTVQASAASWTVELASETISGPLFGDIPFVSFYEGFIYLDVATTANYDLALIIGHELADGTRFSHERHVLRRLSGREVHTEPLADFNSVSVVSLGSYTTQDGRSITLTQSQLDADSTITISLRLTRSDDSNFVLRSASSASMEGHFWQQALGTVSLAKGEQGPAGPAGPIGPTGPTGGRRVSLFAGTTTPSPPSKTSISYNPATGQVTSGGNPWAAVVPSTRWQDFAYWWEIYANVSGSGAIQTVAAADTGGPIRLTGPPGPKGDKGDAGTGGGGDPAATARLDSLDFVVDTYSEAVEKLEGWVIDGWANAGTESTEAGMAIGFEDGSVATYDAITWAATHEDVGSNAGYFIFVRVPSGFPPQFVRMNQVRGNASDAWPHRDQNETWRLQALPGTPKHYEVYALWDTSGDGALLGVEAQAQDDFVLQLADTNYIDPTLPTRSFIAEARNIANQNASKLANVTFDRATDRPLRGTDDLRVGFTRVGSGNAQPSTPSQYAAYNFGLSVAGVESGRYVSAFIALNEDTTSRADWLVNLGGNFTTGAHFNVDVTDRITSGVPAGWKVYGYSQAAPDSSLAPLTVFYLGANDTITVHGHPLDVTWTDGIELASVVDSLGLPPLASGNRDQFIRRKSDETGFDFSDAGVVSGALSLSQLGLSVTLGANSNSALNAWDDVADIVYILIEDANEGGNGILLRKSQFATSQFRVQYGHHQNEWVGVERRNQNLRISNSSTTSNVDNVTVTIFNVTSGPTGPPGPKGDKGDPGVVTGGIPAVTAGGGSGITGIWRGTQTQYDAITSPTATILYIITG